MSEEQWMKLLRRYLARFYELAASEEDMGSKRARSDGQLTMLLAEVALRLPPEEQALIGQMIDVHNTFWELSPPMSALFGRRTPGGV